MLRAINGSFGLDILLSLFVRVIYAHAQRFKFLTAFPLCISFFSKVAFRYTLCSIYNTYRYAHTAIVYLFQAKSIQKVQLLHLFTKRTRILCFLSNNKIQNYISFSKINRNFMHLVYSQVVIVFLISFHSFVCFLQWFRIFVLIISAIYLPTLVLLMHSTIFNLNLFALRMG